MVADVTRDHAVEVVGYALHRADCDCPGDVHHGGRYARLAEAAVDAFDVLTDGALTASERLTAQRCRYGGCRRLALVKGDGYCIEHRGDS